MTDPAVIAFDRFVDFALSDALPCFERLRAEALAAKESAMYDLRKQLKAHGVEITRGMSLERLRELAAKHNTAGAAGTPAGSPASDGASNDAASVMADEVN